MIDGHANDATNEMKIFDMLLIEQAGEWIDSQRVIVTAIRRRAWRVGMPSGDLPRTVFEQAVVGIEHFTGEDQEPLTAETTVVEATFAIEDDPKS